MHYSFYVGYKGKFSKVQILHCHFQMFDPHYMQYLITYVTEDVLFFDLGYCAAIFFTALCQTVFKPLNA